MNRRTVIITVAVMGVFLVGLILWTTGFISLSSKEPIKVGILHSLTGTMAISEKSVVDATMLAIDEINANGGLLGSQIEAVVVDGKSDWPTFAREAEKLITVDKVSAVFGCWTSASRKTVKPVFEKHNHLLFYPVQYEGLESSPNIIYVGAAPNQQISPAFTWCVNKFGKRIFLVASDYVYPRAANEIIKDMAYALDAEVVGEEYILLGSTDVDAAVAGIVSSKPDVIFNTINGDTNIEFFKALRKAGVTADKIPVMSFSIAEDELRQIGAQDMSGNYACWNYFQSLSSPENDLFVSSFKKKYGPDRVTDDPMEAGYVAVYLWANAVTYADSTEIEKLRTVLKGLSYHAPEGLVTIDEYNNHVWKKARIGRMRTDGQFDVVWNSEKAIKPSPYPSSRSRSEWEEFLQNLYTKWNGQWSNPGE